jgi:hypothetical protein
LRILLSDKELAEACMNPQAGQRRWGKSVYKKIVKRLSEFGAAESLLDIATLNLPRLKSRDSCFIDRCHCWSYTVSTGVTSGSSCRTD